MTYEIWGTYNGQTETLEQDLQSPGEAKTLAREYQMAFGADWTIQVMSVYPTFNSAAEIEAVEW